MKRAPIVLPALVAVIFATSCSRNSETGSVVATVGEEVVTGQELLLELRRTALAPAGDDPKGAAMENLLQRKRMVAEAKSRGLTDDPEVRRAIDGILIQRLLEQDLQPQLDEVAVSEAAVEEHYQNSLEDFTRPATTTLAMLFRKSRPEDVRRRSEHREALARAVEETEAAGVAAGEGFGKIAVRNSEHQASRYRGGVLPSLDAGMPLPDLEQTLSDAAAELQAGEFSPIIERPEGLYVVRVVARDGARAESFEAVKNQLRSKLLAQGEAELRESFHRGLEDRFPGEVDEEELASISIELDSQAPAPDEGAPPALDVVRR